jgi:hypothetical protein
VNKTSISLTAAALMACASTAYAAPALYTTGSFAIDAFTGVIQDVTSVSTFQLSSTTVAIGSPAGSMALVSLPPTLTLGSTAANFAVPASLNFTDAGLGAFTATSANSVPSAPNTATWDVLGSFTAGTDWTNAGDTFTANEIWDLTQTGGPGNAISIAATFHAPAVALGTPEPMTLALFGSGLAALAVVRRRKRAT